MKTKKFKIWPEPIGEQSFEFEYSKHTDSVYHIIEKFINERLANTADELPNVKVKVETEDAEYFFDFIPTVTYIAKLTRTVDKITQIELDQEV